MKEWSENEGMGDKRGRKKKIDAKSMRRDCERQQKGKEILVWYMQHFRGIGEGNLRDDTGKRRKVKRTKMGQRYGKRSGEEKVSDGERKGKKSNEEKEEKVGMGRENGMEMMGSEK